MTPHAEKQKEREREILPSPGVGDNDSIVDGEGIGRQTSDVPGSDLDGLSQSLAETVVTAAGNLQCLQHT